MKITHPLIILFVWCTSFLFCLPSRAQSNKILYGTWEIREQTGGLKGGTKKFIKGNGNCLEFSATEYNHSFHGKILEKGKYSLIQKKSLLTQAMETFIQFHPPKPAIEFFTIRVDSLFLKSDVLDGIRYIYLKVK